MLPGVVYDHQDASILMIFWRQERSFDVVGSSAFRGFGMRWKWLLKGGEHDRAALLSPGHASGQGDVSTLPENG